MSEPCRARYFPERPKTWWMYPFYCVKDGDDCLEKTFKVGAITGGGGTIFALMAGLSSTTIDNPALGSNVLMRLAKYSFPSFAAGAVFAATTCTVANLRGGKDDPINHFWGGLTSGSVLGMAMKSYKAGWAWAIALGLGALVYKAGRQEGFLCFDTSTFRREKTLDEYRRSYLVCRPCPEGDQKLQ